MKMRKTRAPSQTVGRKNLSTGGVIPDATRSTSQLLNILSACPRSESSLSFHSNESVPDQKGIKSESYSAAKQDDSTRYYGVVWGKQTKKKHKTWEGDGILIAENDSVILKDQSGAILGRSSKLKSSILEEGCRLLIGSKEIEIIDILNKNSTTSINNERQLNDSVDLVKENVLENSISYSKPKFKRFKTNSSNFSTPFRSSVGECLIMPKPDHAHQWKFNKNKLPVIDVKLDLFLSRLLRPHQQQGVLFLYSCITGMRDPKYTGAILADEMGLGKTLQCIAVVWMLLKTGPYGGIPFIQRVLIVTPSSLVNNWLAEFKRWLSFQRLQPFVVNEKQKPSDYKILPVTNHPLMIISYDMLMRNYDDIKMINFDLLICDEGHRLKNNQSRISILLCQLGIDKKILLTGTPVQNNLQEFFALIEFVNPGIVGTYAEFRKYFELPIVTANQPECSHDTKELGDARSQELNHATNSFILRRTQDIIDQYLPLKQECVIFCSPSPFQIELCEAVVSFWENNLNEESFKVPHLNVITILKKICNDPQLVKMEKVVNDSDDDFICDIFKKSLLDYLQPIFLKFCDVKDSETSSKMMILDNFLCELKALNERVVLISYFTQTLELFENLCSRNQYAFLRLDGSTSVSARSEAVQKFNAPDSKYFIFLLSAKAGGLGLNLVGASRLVLFDLDWNPASDLQAMSRIWRDGQKKNVFIYRFLTAGSIEEKIYQRQISKTFLSNAVVDTRKGSTVRLSNEELKDLFSFHFDCPSLTHQSLMCNCKGDGMPETGIDNEIYEDNDDKRDGQLSILHEKKVKDNSKISELIEWEHFSPSIPESVLEELCLKSSGDHISFIFRNKHARSTSFSS